VPVKESGTVGLFSFWFSRLPKLQERVVVAGKSDGRWRRSLPDDAASPDGARKLKSGFPSSSTWQCSGAAKSNRQTEDMRANQSREPGLGCLLCLCELSKTCTAPMPWPLSRFRIEARDGL
jgi:hypothetical protein